MMLAPWRRRVTCTVCWITASVCARGDLHLGRKRHVASAYKWRYTCVASCEGLSHPGLTAPLTLFACRQSDLAATWTALPMAASF